MVSSAKALATEVAAGHFGLGGTTQPYPIELGGGPGGGGGGAGIVEAGGAGGIGGMAVALALASTSPRLSATYWVPDCTAVLGSPS